MAFAPVHLLCSAALLALPVYAQAKDWEKIRQQGFMQLVAVTKAKEGNREVYEDAVRALCTPRQRCYVLFWSDRAMVPRRLPMTDAEVAAQTGSYTRNPSTGHDELWLLCRYGQRGGKCIGP